MRNGSYTNADKPRLTHKSKYMFFLKASIPNHPNMSSEQGDCQTGKDAKNYKSKQGQNMKLVTNMHNEISQRTNKTEKQARYSNFLL